MSGYTIKLGKMAFILLHHVAMGLGVVFAGIKKVSEYLTVAERHYKDVRM
jgi:hypothetical protein